MFLKKMFLKNSAERERTDDPGKINLITSFDLEDPQWQQRKQSADHESVQQAPLLKRWNGFDGQGLVRRRFYLLFTLSVGKPGNWQHQQ